MIKAKVDPQNVKRLPDRRKIIFSVIRQILKDAVTAVRASKGI